jgi:Holliday junction resolvasome RuvABC DNA-binding subunit
MNQQPEQFIINIFSIFFVLLVLYYAATSKNKTNIFTNDMIDILHEVESKPINKIHKITYAKIKKTKPKQVDDNSNKYDNQSNENIKQDQNNEQQKQAITQKTFNELHHDCVNALMSLGMKKKESVNTVIRIFNKYEINSIEDFIKKAFVPNEYYRSST